MNQVSGKAIITMLTAISAANSLAEEAAVTLVQTAPKSLQPLSYGNALNVIGSLMLVLALLFAAAWVMRRGQGFIKPKTGHIQIVSHIALGVKEKVLLLKVGEENILVACSSGNMRSLHTWRGALPDLIDGDHKGADNFLSVLQQQLRPKQTGQSGVQDEKGPTQ